MDTDEKPAVAETLYRYAAAVDRRDWTLYRSLFADAVHVDFSSFDPGLRPQEVDANDWVAGVASVFGGLASTQHSMSNPRVTVGDDEAQITMHVRAHHVFDADDPDSWYTVGGFYDDTLVRSAGEWVLTGVRLTVTWRAGDPRVMELARRRRQR